MDRDFLEKTLKVSDSFFDLCERYGCAGLWSAQDIIKPNVEVLEKSELKLISQVTDVSESQN